jgi:SAM-dependent methyltransferase
VNCRVCHGRDFREVIDLGAMPLVNNLLDDPSQDCPRWPLQVVRCEDCSLCQLTESVPSGAMFDNYVYFTGQSRTMVAHAQSLVRKHIEPGHRVVEIASNDGYLLEHAQKRGAHVLGIEPAKNIAAWAMAKGVPTRCTYFGAAAAHDILSDWGRADRIFANNVLAHVPDPHDLVAGIKLILAPHGVAHVEVPWVLEMIRSGAFDTIYHEHQSYFSCSALHNLVQQHGLRVTSVEVSPIHGGSLHLQLGHDGDDSKARQFREKEKQFGLFAETTYVRFRDRVFALKDEAHGALTHFNDLAAYGAAAKGVVALNFLGLDASRVPWVADISPHKQGKFIPGTRQPIVSPEELLRRLPSAALLLPWNIAAEIVDQHRTYLAKGGRFVRLIPRITIYDINNATAAGDARARRHKSDLRAGRNCRRQHRPASAHPR